MINKIGSKEYQQNCVQSLRNGKSNKLSIFVFVFFVEKIEKKNRNDKDKSLTLIVSFLSLICKGSQLC